MFSKQAEFMLAALAILGGQNLVQAQARFGKPVAVDAQHVAEKTPKVSNLPGPKDGIDKLPNPQKLQVPGPQGVKEPVTDEFGLKPPSRDELFRVQSEQSLMERLRQGLPNMKKVEFPKEAPPPVVPTADLTQFPEQTVFPLAGEVCYRPLYFEDKCTERFGYYVPCLQPLLSAERFYCDVLLLPMRMCMTPPWTYECDNR